MASGLWVFTWQTWVEELNRRTATLLKPDYSLLFGLGVLLYLSTVAVQYLILEIDVSGAGIGDAGDFADVAEGVGVIDFAEAQRLAYAHKVTEHAARGGGGLTVAVAVADYIAWLRAGNER